MDNDKIMYPERIYDNTFSSHSYSARRDRKREHYQIVKCNTCGLVRSNPVLSENKVNSFYADSKCCYKEEAPFVAETYKKLLNTLMLKHPGSYQSLIEVGCGTGFFLEKAIELGFKDIIGFEPSRDCYKQATDHIKKHIIQDVYRPELLGEKKYDIAASFHVWDHLSDPRKSLLSLIENLRPGGHVLMVCHDVESWSAKILGSYSPIFDIEHVYLFSQQTIRKLYESAGLDVVEVGSLMNCYPLGYWLRMLPAMGGVAKALPLIVRNVRVSLRAGNLYIYGKKNEHWKN